MRNASRHHAARSKLPLKVALTGGAGSGKSAVGERLRALGLQVVDTDILAREVAAPGSPGFREIVAAFGRKIVRADGVLDRPALRRIIMGDAEARRSLEQILHPRIIRRLEALTAEAAASGCTVLFVEVPLLFEAGWNDYFNVIVAVLADEETRIQRLMERDRVSRKQARALLQIQKPDAEKIKGSDFIIKNCGSPEQLATAVHEFLERFWDKIQKNDKSA